MFGKGLINSVSGKILLSCHSPVSLLNSHICYPLYFCFFDLTFSFSSMQLYYLLCSPKGKHIVAPSSVCPSRRLSIRRKPFLHKPFTEFDKTSCMNSLGYCADVHLLIIQFDALSQKKEFSCKIPIFTNISFIFCQNFMKLQNYIVYYKFHHETLFFYLWVFQFDALS